MSTNLTLQVLLTPVLGIEAVMLTDGRDWFSPMLSRLLSVAVRFTLVMPKNKIMIFLAFEICATLVHSWRRNFSRFKNWYMYHSTTPNVFDRKQLMVCTNDFFLLNLMKLTACIMRLGHTIQLVLTYAGGHRVVFAFHFLRKSLRIFLIHLTWS